MNNIIQKNVFDKNSPIVINLFGPPGSGKSTTAAYIFAKLKMNGVNAELVTEFAKDKVWESASGVFGDDNQPYIFGEQWYRMNRCRDKVDVIVTDSPLLLSILYKKGPVFGDSFDRTVEDAFRSFDNISYLVKRNKPYNPAGRNQTEEESDVLYNDIHDVLTNLEINFDPINGSSEECNQIADYVLKIIKNK